MPEKKHVEGVVQTEVPVEVPVATQTEEIVSPVAVVSQSVPVEKPAAEPLSHVEVIEAEKPSPTHGKPPVILPYGAGNTHPAAPNQFMKSFNAKVPESEQYPSIQSRTARIKDYDSHRREKMKVKEEETIKTSTNALESFLKAREVVNDVLDRYKTEYQRQYLNWNKNVVVNKDLKPGPEKKETKPVKEAQRISFRASKPAELKTAPKQSAVKETMVEESVQTNGSEEVLIVSPTAVVVQPLPIIDKLIPAGVNQIDYHQKRHYPYKKDSLQVQIEEMEKRLFQELGIKPVPKWPLVKEQDKPILKYAVKHPELESKSK